MLLVDVRFAAELSCSKVDQHVITGLLSPQIVFTDVSPDFFPLFKSFGAMTVNMVISVERRWSSMRYGALGFMWTEYE